MRATRPDHCRAVLQRPLQRVDRRAHPAIGSRVSPCAHHSLGDDAAEITQPRNRGWEAGRTRLGRIRQRQDDRPGRVGGYLARGILGESARPGGGADQNGLVHPPNHCFGHGQLGRGEGGASIGEGAVQNPAPGGRMGIIFHLAPRLPEIGPGPCASRTLSRVSRAEVPLESR